MGVILKWICPAFLLFSLIVNAVFVVLYVRENSEEKVGWSGSAGKEAEVVAAVTCSGHGRVYLDGLMVDGHPACECNSCYEGPDCSLFSSDCAVDIENGDPLFLEPFWMEHAKSSAVVINGWHRMGYSFNDGSTISQELEKVILDLHDLVGNANTTSRFIVFGAGSTQLLNAAVHALSPHNSTHPANVVVSIPYYPVYKTQTEVLDSEDFQFEGDVTKFKNSSVSNTTFVEFVTSPNNPDGKLTKAVLQGPNAKPIHDRAYYWPHYTPIPAPADDDLMLFTLSKLTGHAGTRFGWALVKDKDVFEAMVTYMNRNTEGVSRDSQLRALKLLKVVLEGDGREIFEFSANTLKDRWDQLNETLSMSKRFSFQELTPHNCTFFNQVRTPSPAYLWLKCERKEDKDCPAAIRKGGIIGRNGTLYGSDSSYVRMSLIKTQDEFNAPEIERFSRQREVEWKSDHIHTFMSVCMHMTSCIN